MFIIIIIIVVEDRDGEVCTKNNEQTNNTASLLRIGQEADVLQLIPIHTQPGQVPKLCHVYALEKKTSTKTHFSHHLLSQCHSLLQTTVKWRLTQQYWDSLYRWQELTQLYYEPQCYKCKIWIKYCILVYIASINILWLSQYWLLLSAIYSTTDQQQKQNRWKQSCPIPNRLWLYRNKTRVKQTVYITRSHSQNNDSSIIDGCSALNFVGIKTISWCYIYIYIYHPPPSRGSIVEFWRLKLSGTLGVEKKQKQCF